MDWLVKLLGPIGWLVDPVTKGVQLVEKITGALGATASAEATAAANVQIAAINARVAQMQSAKEIRLATAGFWEMRLMTFLIASPFVFHLWSVWLDTQFHLGLRLDKFPSPFDQWEGAILLSFFGVSVVGVGIKAVAGAIAFRRGAQ
jgi:hypothetical protein